MTASIYNQKGQSSLEYIVILAFAAIFALTVAGSFNSAIKTGVGNLESALSAQLGTGLGW